MNSFSCIMYPLFVLHMEITDAVNYFLTLDDDLKGNLWKLRLKNWSFGSVVS